ncbi:uncharacterized protein LOC135953482 [Calliphora vicina]|uniref:uncharacterized protein LOC135953482 n=1 Tax=Calliphora vicina TaxID=7373 RepID=UPI00325B3CB4
MKTWLYLAFVLNLLSNIQGDTKVIREVNILFDDTFRQETFSLKNEEELIIAGTLMQKIYPKDNIEFVYRFETIYVADKNGYRVKFKLIREPNVQVVLQLNPSTLKSAAG